MSDPSTPRDDERGPVRLGRRRFLGAGLAAAGAAFIPPATTALRGTYPHLPAVPVDAEGSAETLVKLALRSQQAIQAKQGLTREFTLAGQRQTAYAFLF